MSVETIRAAILEGEAGQTVTETRAALEEGIDALRILREGCSSAAIAAYRALKDGEKLLPEVFVCGRAVQACLAVLQPALDESGIAPPGILVTGSIDERTQGVEKHLATMLWHASGFEVIDVGANAMPEEYARAALQAGADLVVLWAGMPTAAVRIREVVRLLSSAVQRNRIRVMVGSSIGVEWLGDALHVDALVTDAEGALRRTKEMLCLNWMREP